MNPGPQRALPGAIPRAACAAAAFAMATLAAPGAAVAGAGVITTVVTPLTPAVTYSVAASALPARPALNTYVGYTVSITNTGGNTINSVRFTGSVAATDADEKPTFSSVEGATCNASASLAAIECTIGQLRAGESFPSFAVFFKAPAKDAVSPLPDGNSGNCAATDCVAFSGLTYYAEGTGGANSVPQNSTAAWSAGAVTLGTFNPTLVRSALPKSGGRLFTGSGGISTGSDKFATAVVVPAAASYTTAVISEALDPVLPAGVNCNSNFRTCYRSDITIPGTFSPYLTIVLRQDVSTILNGTRIESVLIKYTGAGGTVFVGDCASPTTPRSDGIPCLAQRVHYRNSKVPGWTPELDGDFEWTLINLGNGSYTIF